MPFVHLTCTVCYLKQRGIMGNYRNFSLTRVYEGHFSPIYCLSVMEWYTCVYLKCALHAPSMYSKICPTCALLAPDMCPSCTLFVQEMCPSCTLYVPYSVWWKIMNFSPPLQHYPALQSSFLLISSPSRLGCVSLSYLTQVYTWGTREGVCSIKRLLQQEDTWRPVWSLPSHVHISSCGGDVHLHTCSTGTQVEKKN